MENRGQIFDKLFNEYKDKLYRLCFSYCGAHAVAEDLLQESFSKIWLHLDTFKHQSSYSTWMYRITVNTCLTYLRSNKSKTVALVDGFADVASSENYTEEPINQLNIAIMQLQEIDRIMIGMVLEDMSYKEIGEVMGMQENNVGVKVYRIKRQLKKILERIGYHE